MFDPASGWVVWHPDDREMTTVNRSADWFMGSSEPLRPALIKTQEVPPGDA
jgi:hypothetical protein